MASRVHILVLQYRRASGLTTQPAAGSRILPDIGGVLSWCISFRTIRQGMHAYYRPQRSIAIALRKDKRHGHKIFFLRIQKEVIHKVSVFWFASLISLILFSCIVPEAVEAT